MKTKINKTLLIVALFGLLLAGNAFAYKYVMNGSATYSYVTPTTQVAALTGGTWDDGYFDYALPGDFDFYYYGRKVTHLRISTNGYIIFGFGSATGDGTVSLNVTIPEPATVPDSMVAVAWDNWDLTPYGGIYYDVVGTAPNRILAVEWRGVPHAGSVLPDAFTFEVVLYETSNDIRLQYADVEQGSYYDGAKRATIGVEHPTGLQGELYAYEELDPDALLVTNGQAILFTPFVHVYDTTDFNGDTMPDLTIFRSSNSMWYVAGVKAWSVTAEKGDIPVPGDYDGDGMAYRAMYTPSTSTWHTELGDIVYGTEGDIPVPADYNNDGFTDIAVFRPSNGIWYVYGLGAKTYGAAGDIPFPADIDGDGTPEYVIWRPSNGMWYVRGWGARSYGTAGDIPLPADYDGDTTADFAVWRYSNGIWYVRGVGASSHGMDGDVLVPADVNGDGATDLVVWRPSDGTWYVFNLGFLAYGTLADIPMLK
ncbi:MAG: VCBS repeat-containing protein [Candidatus Aminicenantes bacterium]|nr:MAG: VCBS repeat-containing protein [Candidatus Aminicenantes bacterium]